MEPGSITGVSRVWNSFEVGDNTHLAAIITWRAIVMPLQVYVTTPRLTTVDEGRSVAIVPQTHSCAGERKVRRRGRRYKG